MLNKGLSCFLIFVVSAACTSNEPEKVTTPPLIEYKVHSVMPHDTGSFTEGLLVYNGKLYESTGEEGQSWFGRINIKTGQPEKKVDLDEKYFGEGITILNNKIYQLTYKTRVGFIYSLESFEKVGEFGYESEGWGLTQDGANLIMSNGSSKLHYLDTVTLQVVKSVKVSHNSVPVKMLNELEFINGYIFANVWQTNQILKIDASSGEVVGFLDLSLLAREAKRKNPDADVLNGIAWYGPTQSLLVTGKYWPEIYALKLKE